jgi:hypothetical protein
MKRTNLFPRVLFLGVVLAAALTSLSCDSSAGVGVGVGYPTRYGGGAGRPPVFVGGPSF